QISGVNGAAGGVDGFGVAGDGKVYEYAYHTVYQFQYLGASGPVWQQISGLNGVAGDVEEFRLGQDGFVYTLAHSSLYRYHGPVGNIWDKITTGILSFEVSPDVIFCRGSDHELYKIEANGQKTRIDIGYVQTVGSYSLDATG